MTLFLVVPGVGVAWAWLVRYLLKSSSELHKTHYKLAESGKGVSRISVPGVNDATSSSGKREGLRLEVRPQVRLVGNETKFSWRIAARSPVVM